MSSPRGRLILVPNSLDFGVAGDAPPLQDVLRLGREARMNLPGSEGGTNWKWRYDAKALTGRLADELRAMTKRAKRG